MAQKKLQVMISSRSDKGSIDDGKGNPMLLREARKRLKTELENENFLGTPLLEVWINEAEVGDGDGTAWEECLQRARGCDLFISLYDGHPGWSDGSGVGICEAEFDAAFSTAPAKVKVVRLPGTKFRSGDEVAERYFNALARARRFEVHVKGAFPDLRKAMLQVVRELLLKTAHEGARQHRRSAGSLGLALDWSRLDFTARAKAIVAEISQEVANSKFPQNGERQDLALRDLPEGACLFACHGAARALSNSTARELLGKPFLHDHEIVAQLTDASISGPIHLIGCPGTPTAVQAETLLGATDVFTVKAAFGVYCVDRLNKIQICLLSECEDPGSTRNSALRFFEWLEQSGERAEMLKRGQARRRIVEAILREQA